MKKRRQEQKYSNLILRVAELMWGELAAIKRFKS